MPRSHAALALSIALCASAARAQTSDARPPVRWQPGRCDGVDLARARRVLQVELQDLLASDDAPDALRVTLACDRERVTLRASGRGGPIERAYAWSALPATPAARARTLALVAVELAFLSWVQRPTPAAEPPSAAPSAGATRAPAAAYAPAPSIDRGAWTLSASTSLGALQRGPSLWGGGLMVSRELSSGFALRLDAQGAAGALDGATLARWDVGVSAGMVAPWRAWRFQLDAGFRAGAAYVQREGAAWDVAPWVSPSLRVGGSLRLTDALSWDLSARMGFGVTVGERSPSGVFEGVWCGVQTGLSARW